MDDTRGQANRVSVEIPAGSDREAFLVIGVERCPYCDYELAGLRARQCPECGAEITDEDIRLDARRRVYLELTRWSVVWGNLMLLGLCLVFTLSIAILPYVLGLAAVSLVRGPSGNGVVRRVQRRVWLVAIGRLYSPWVVLVMLHSVLSLMFWNPYYMYEFGSVFQTVLVYFGPEIAVTIGVALYLAGAWLWRRRLRRVGRVAGLTEVQMSSAFPIRGGATRLAVGPVVGIGIAAAVSLAIMRVLQMFWPDWGWGLF